MPVATPTMTCVRPFRYGGIEQTPGEPVRPEPAFRDRGWIVHGGFATTTVDSAELLRRLAAPSHYLRLEAAEQARTEHPAGRNKPDIAGTGTGTAEAAENGGAGDETTENTATTRPKAARSRRKRPENTAGAT